MIKGIGPIYAKKLVKAFRETVFDVIEQTPERLKEIDGIGPKRADSIVAAWADQKAIREIMIFLHSHGVGTSRAVRIFKTYGADAIRLISENPYRLARDIRGIGFKSADQIAEKLGIEKTAMIRARAGIGYALTEAMDEGHCGLPLAQLVPMAVKLLEVPAEIIETALDLELQDGEVVADTVDGERCIFLAGLHRAERAIAARIMALCSGTLPWPSHRCRESHPMGRDQGGHHPRRQPTRGGASGADSQGARHHRRARRRQDDADELDPEDPERQERADCAGRTHRARRKAAVGEHRPRGKDHPPAARSRSDARRLPPGADPPADLRAAPPGETQEAAENQLIARTRRCPASAPTGNRAALFATSPSVRRPRAAALASSNSATMVSACAKRGSATAHPTRPMPSPKDAAKTLTTAPFDVHTTRLTLMSVVNDSGRSEASERRGSRRT